VKQTPAEPIPINSGNRIHFTQGMKIANGPKIQGILTDHVMGILNPESSHHNRY